MKIFFIRHAEGYHNVLKNGHDILSPELTDDGINQAINLSKLFEEIKIDIVAVSPLRRTLHTAEIIFGRRYFEILEDIREKVSYNCDFRESKNDLEVMFPYVNFSSLNDKVDYNKVENEDDINKRLDKFYNWLLENNHYNNLVVVSHGNFLDRFLHKYYSKLEIPGFNYLYNCGIQIGSI